MYVFRIHIRPKAGAPDMGATFDHCIRSGVLGVGWRTPSNRNTKNWDEFYKEASLEYDDLNVCKYIHKWVSPGDLVWTRSPAGQYYIGRVTSGWEYWTTEESRRLDLDVSNIFRCELKPVEIDEVPGKIVACFRPSRTIQEIGDDKACEYSKHLWNVLSGEDIYPIDKARYSDVFMMLDSEETEDLVFVYLQSKGWYVIPHSRKRDTMAFEYLCVNPLTGEVAGTQVKTGESSLNRDEYAQLPTRTFLFQSNERYSGAENEKVETISRAELLDFLTQSIRWLPKSFKRKLEIVSP